MAFFNEFPNTRTYDSDLGWIIATVKKLIDRIDGYNEVHFADPLAWDITSQYNTATIVRDTNTGDLYISKQDVPNGILLSNSAYWEVLGTGSSTDICEIKNVADYGALGVAGADYTTEIQNAINDGSIIYFPAGEYSFKGINVSKPLYIFGEGETTVWKPQHRITTSNQYATMLASADDLVIDGIKFEGDNSIVTQTGTQYYQSAIVQSTGKKFRMTNCIIEDIYDTYHLSQGDLEFYDRNGLLLFVSEAQNVEIDHNTFGNYGGEELIWISRALANFGDNANILIHDNTFRDRTMQNNGGLIDGGSAINVLGGNILFTNNYGQNYYERGSFANLLGDTVEAANNTFYNCTMSSWLDCCEGYYCKAKSVNVHNNWYEDKTGVTTYAVKAMAVNISITDNHLEGNCPIKTYGLTAAAQNPAGQSYIGDNSDWATYKLTRISGNTLVLTSDAPDARNSGISLQQTNQAAGSRSVLDECIVENNDMINEGVTTYYNTLFVQGRVKYFVIKDNRFPFAGTSIPSLSANAVICINENVVSGDFMLIDGNYFDDDVHNTNIRIFNSVSSTLPNVTAVCVGNAVRSTAASKIFAGSTATGFSGDYNYNFSAII